MPLLSADETPDRVPRLSRGDWIEAALAVLLDEGVDAVQITRLAKRLGVTRGSFYWHFTDRAAVLKALVAEWRARNTGVMVTALENASSLNDGIFELFLVWVDHRRFDPVLDQALRDWARRDADIRQIVAAEDDQRVEAVAAFYRRMGYEPTDAFIRARVLYFTQVTYYALDVNEPMPQRMSYLAAYYRTFTGRELDEADATDFRARLAAAEATS